MGVVALMRGGEHEGVILHLRSGCDRGVSGNVISTYKQYIQ